jgi:hypothetical protein
MVKDGRALVLAWVRSNLEKSKTSSDSNLKIFMVFSQSVSEVLDAPTMSGINDCHLWGQSCFRI